MTVINRHIIIRTFRSTKVYNTINVFRALRIDNAIFHDNAVIGTDSRRRAGDYQYSLKTDNDWCARLRSVLPSWQKWILNGEHVSDGRSHEALPANRGHKHDSVRPRRTRDTSNGKYEARRRPHSRLTPPPSASTRRHGLAAARPAAVRQPAGVPVPGQGGRDIRRQRRWRCARRQLRHTVPEGLQPGGHGIGLRQETVHTAGQAPRPNPVPDREVFADHVRLRHTRHARRRLRDGAQVQRGVLHQ